MEIILIDDGSSDKSGDICDSYAKQDSRIKVIHRENKGIAYTRNEGLDKAKGDYITFVDSDDYIHPQMYELMMRKLNEQNADVVVCDYLKILENEAPSICKLNVDNISINMIEDIQEKKKYIYLDKYVDALLVWNKIIKKELWDGIRCPQGNVIYEDETITFRTLYYARRIVYLNEKLYYHVKRNNNTSITGAAFSERRLLRLDALEVRLDFYIEQKEWEFLSEAFFAYKTDFLVIMEHIEKSSDYTIAILKPYLKKYRQYCRKYLWKMKMPAKKKIQYIYFAIAPESYYRRYRKKKNKE